MSLPKSSPDAKINLIGPGNEPELVFSVGIKRGAMKTPAVRVAQHHGALLEAWERIHGTSDR